MDVLPSHPEMKKSVKTRRSESRIITNASKVSCKCRKLGMVSDHPLRVWLVIGMEMFRFFSQVEMFSSLSLSLLMSKWTRHVDFPRKPSQLFFPDDGLLRLLLEGRKDERKKRQKHLCKRVSSQRSKSKEKVTQPEIRFLP